MFPPSAQMVKDAQRTINPVHSDEQPSEFVFNYDFDENGALYYLGTHGGTRLW